MGFTREEKVLWRLDRLLGQHLQNALYRHTCPVSIESWDVAGEPVDFQTAKQAEYRPMSVGDPWGTAWDTWWLHVTGQVPAEWANEADTRPELVVDLGRVGLGPGFQAEGLVRRPDGTVIKAVEPFNGWVPVPEPGQPCEFYIEAASNPQISNGGSFHPTELGNEGVGKEQGIYRLQRLELGLLDLQVWNLIQELKVLEGLLHEVDPTRTRYANILDAIEAALNSIDPNDVAGTARRARQCLVDVLSAPATKGHTVYAVGHAHIDSAWLWPLRETPRKVARTFSNAVELADEYPDFIFAASSAQQYQWLKDSEPDVYEGVKRKIRSGQFVPVGGMWVESDANLPGGESLVRQFLQGGRFFQEEFGVTSHVAWLPDSFGYSGAFPQIARLAGMDYFLTQKISWNDTDTFPFHSFMWQGIDGTEIFTHFPPADKYNSDASPADVARSEKNFTEKGKGASSLLLYGWGDGGGGPTREMVAATELQKNLEGGPRVLMTSPETFFRQAKEEMKDPPRWVGELYLELHRGTATSQAATKSGNKRSESLLRQAEWWASQAAILCGTPYPYEELQEIWRKVLLYQFHDILPGSAIAWVYAEVQRSDRKIWAQLEEIIDRSLKALAGSGPVQLEANAGPLSQEGVRAGAVAVPVSTASGQARREGDDTVLENDRVSFRIDASGHVVSAVDRASGREVIDPAAPANVLRLFVDAPAHWDAWDIDKTYQDMELPGAQVEGTALTDQGTVTVSGTIGQSTFSQELSLDDDTDALVIRTHVDWKESDRLLKLSFPTNLYTKESVNEIQFGHLTRPVTENTSWEQARFEAAAQRWVHIQEGDFGVSLANCTNYGHDIHQFVLPDGRPGTRIQISLLRAPHFPDPRADLGEHDFTVALGVGTDIRRAIRMGYRLNVPVRRLTGAHPVDPLVEVDGQDVLIESVKLAEDRSGDLVVRLYESAGARSRARLTAGFDWSSVDEVGLMEVPCDAVQPAIRSKGEDGIDLELHPFQIVTLRFHRS